MRQATIERQRRVMSEVLDRKHVTVRDLAGNMGVSQATVRRDLRSLADTQQLSLVHGGATLSRTSGDFSFTAKHDRNLAAKRQIAQLAAALVEDGSQLFLDSGTTSFEMAPFLSSKRGLSIVLNSARLALELRSQNPASQTSSDHHIILLGGHFRPDRMDTVGPIALGNLEQLRGFTTFIGADGLSMEVGPAAVDMESSHLYRMAVANARQTILLVDHTKFLAPSLFKIVDWPKINHVITDTPPSDDWLHFFATQNIRLHHPKNTNGHMET